MPPPPSTPDALSSLKHLVEFPDNRLLIDLCGEYDRNLADIEQKLAVQILRRGNQLVVIGDETSSAEAVAVPAALYERLESGRNVDPGDVDRELRMDTETGADSGDQIEMFKQRRVEIKTRKKTGRAAHRRAEGLCRIALCQ